MSCFGCKFNAGTTIRFIRAGICSKCGSSAGTNWIATYTHDSVDKDGSLWHHVKHAATRVCQQCGHTSDTGKMKCKGGGNSISAKKQEPQHERQTQ